MISDCVVQERQLDLEKCRQLCLRPPFDIERLLRLGGLTVGSWEPTLVPLGSAISMLIRSRAMDAGFEPAVTSQWLPHLRNETLLTLGEDLQAWDCPRYFKSWDEFVRQFYGQGRDVRSRIAGHLKCSLADTAATVRIYSATDVEAFGRFSDAPQRSGPAPRAIIRADDIADRVRQVCGTVMFTVHPRERAEA